MIATWFLSVQDSVWLFNNFFSHNVFLSSDLLHLEICEQNKKLADILDPFSTFEE